LNNLPNGFPRTEAGYEIEILKRIFTEPEAAVASTLSIDYESAQTIAERSNSDTENTQQILDGMVKKGAIWVTSVKDKTRYRLAPFIVGSYEAQLYNMDHSFAHLVEDYFQAGGVEGIMKPLPGLHRVVPAQGAVKTEWVLPYDDIKSVIDSNVSFRNNECICRKQQRLIGNECEFPSNYCLSISSHERSPRPNDISKQEALALLDEVEKIGLVHTVSNVMEGLSYVCNCCGCCCGIIRGLTEFGYESSIAVANYYAEIDTDACTGCGLCENRCQVSAIKMADDKAVIKLDNCIGCGLCVTGCPVNAATLSLKPEDQIVDPPINYPAWEEKRLKNRGLA
jgi:NAD-dependent dihydropyrimidine dehydrogenase PreA subunit